MSDSGMSDAKASWRLGVLVLSVLGYSLPVFVAILAWRDTGYRKELFDSMQDIGGLIVHIVQESGERMDASLLVTAIVSLAVALLVTRFLNELPWIFRILLGLIITVAVSSILVAWLLS
jgi:hypothetical protein